MPATMTAVPPCPKCGGDMFDNRLSKKNPKAPNFRCKDREGCDGVIWPPRNGELPSAPGMGVKGVDFNKELAAQETHEKAVVEKIVGKDVLSGVATLFTDCVIEAEMIMRHIREKLGYHPTANDLLYTASCLSMALRDAKKANLGYTGPK
jgi:hypothetical protein